MEFKNEKQKVAVNVADRGSGRQSFYRKRGNAEVCVGPTVKVSYWTLWDPTGRDPHRSLRGKLYCVAWAPLPGLIL